MSRSGHYYVRVRVPRDLVGRVGLLEIRRSIGPIGFHDARLLAAKIGTKLKKVFTMLRSANDLTKQETLNLFQDCFTDLGEKMGQGYMPKTNEIDFELSEQQSLAEMHSSALEAQLETRQFDAPTVNGAKHFAAEHSVDLSGASDQRLTEIVEGVVRAMVEADKQFVFRLKERLLPYKPEDPLFSQSPRNSAQGIGLTVDELIEEYCKANRHNWTAKTMKTHRPKLRLLSDFLGGDTRAEDVTRDNIRPYPAALTRLRKKYHLVSNNTLQSSQTNAEHARIQPSTATTILARATAMFRWAEAQGYISSNPAVGLSISAPKKKKGHKSRRSFTKDELQKLFSSPLFTGSHSRIQRFEAGDSIIRDERFFLPILGYYTGARLGEMVQLHFSDCILDGPAPHISINENGEEKHGQDGHKHVKSNSGVRLIPLHPDLFELGFGEFVQSQRKSRGKSKRVFHGIKYGADGQPSTPFSKWFGRALDKVGLSDSALVFHSFRHTTEDYLRSSLVPQYVIDQLIGHQDPSSAGAYGMGISIEKAYEIVKNIKLPIRLPDILG